MPPRTSPRPVPEIRVSAAGAARRPRAASPAAVQRLPLIDPDRPLRTLAWRGSVGVSQRQFLASVHALARRLPAATHALNLCEDRYQFMVAFAAICLRGQTNLLPPSAVPGAIAEIAGGYPGCYAVGDGAPLALPLRWIAVDDDGIDDDRHDADEAARAAMPSIAADHIAALAFTSGSSGAPRAHAKTWQSLVQTARLAAQRFAVDGLPQVSVVATVPPQHMYGLETTVMMAFAGGYAAHSGRSFFPAELRLALLQVPAPRVLITTPVHLRSCLAAGLPLPRLQRVVCATAPLAPERAAAAEAQLGAPVFEIYGCTEAGSVATRRTVAAPAWTLFAGMHLSRQDDATVVHGAHLGAAVMLPDLLEDLGEGRFHLRGRNGDMLKVAGKRASLGDLTLRLLRIPGVSDAVVFVPPAKAGREARPAALVVAPGFSPSQILAALQATIDPVFLPRPLLCLPCLPRNAVGKLPRAALLAELRQHHG